MSSQAPHSGTMSTQRFWLYTIGLVIVWTVVISSAELSGSKSSSSLIAIKNTFTQNSDKEVKNSRNCKALCEHCGCLGFYCGEECICECDNDNSDTECIAAMQSNARKLAIPFEILIQGPTVNRFVRTAQQFEQNANVPFGRTKRSTVVIYKPTSQQNSLLPPPATAHKLLSEKKASIRHKRGVSQSDWFTDLANTLVRPAPFGGARHKEESEKSSKPASTAQYTTNNDVDRSWFSDNNMRLLKPSPLFKRSGTNENGDSEIPQAVRVVEKIPHVLKETIRHIKEATLADDFTEAMRSTITDGNEVLQNNMQPNFDFFPSNIRNDLSDVISRLKNLGGDLDVARTESPPAIPKSEPKYVTWFRPVRFLHRVHQAINDRY